MGVYSDYLGKQFSFDELSNERKKTVTENFKYKTT